MESLTKQIRVIFSGTGQHSQEETTSARRTQSFKTEKKNKGQNWLLRQFSGMGPDSESSRDGEFETAIAAAAYAIMAALEEEDSLKKIKPSEASLPRTKSRKVDTPTSPPEPGRISRLFTGKEVTEDKRSAGDETAKKKPEPVENKSSEVLAADQKIPEKVISRVPSKKKTVSFGPDVTDRPLSRKTESTLQGANSSCFEKPAAPTEVGTQRSFWTKGRFEEKASAWEKAQMAKIKKRYEKQSETIQSWENDKKTKARRRFDREEKNLELRRAMVTQEYREEMERINNIAAGARSLAEERKRNEEAKTKEKVKKIRSTGKVPITCFCF